MASLLYDGKQITFFGYNGNHNVKYKYLNNMCNKFFSENNISIKAIANSITHYMILTNDGKLYVFGSNKNYELGIPNKRNIENLRFINFPKLLMVDPSIKTIACGLYGSMILKENGDLFVCGKNYYRHINSLIKKQNLYNDYIEKFTLSMKNVKSIVCGKDELLILKNNGELFNLRSNKSKLLMIDNEIKSIRGGSFHFMILKNNGELFVWGDNGYGQLGLGNDIRYVGGTPILLMTNSKIREVYCGFYQSIILLNDGKLFMCGNKYCSKWYPSTNRVYDLTLLMKDPNIQFVSINHQHSTIVKNNGDVFIIGNNKSGCLIKSDTEKYLSFPTFAFTLPNIKLVSNSSQILMWSCENHKYFPLDFRVSIWAFLLCMKKHQIDTGIKIPRFVLYEIIKFIV